jgi:hypothetical protein
MPVATLAQIQAALFAALAPLGPGPAGNATFVTLDPWAGELVSGTPLDRDALVNLPAAWVAWAGEETDARESVATLARRTVQVVGRSTWIVYLAVEDARGDARALDGQTGMPGLLERVQLVAAALSGLAIPGLYDRGAVEYVGARPVRVEPGVYVYSVRLATERAVEALPAADPTVPFTGVLANEHLVGDDSAGAPDPALTFTAP